MSGVFRSISKVTVGNLLYVLCNFVTTVYLARQLASVQLGQYFYLMMIANVCVSVMNFGFSISYVRNFGNKPLVDSTCDLCVLLIQSITVITILFCLLIFEKNLLHLLSIRDFRSLLVMFFLVSTEYLLFMALVTLQALRMFTLYATIKITSSVVFLALVVFIPQCTVDVVDGVFRLRVASNASLVLLLVFLAILVIGKRFDLSAIRLGKLYERLFELYKFGTPLGINGVLTVFFSRIDMFIVEWLLGYEGVAILGLAQRIPLALRRVFESIRVVLISQLSGYFFENQFHRIEQVVTKAASLFILVGGVSCVLCYLIGCDLMVFIFKDKFIGACIPFFILCFTIPIAFISNLYGTTIVVLGKSHYPMITNSLMAFSAVVCNYFLIPHWGVAGAAMATLLSTVAVLPVNCLLLKRLNVVRLGFVSIFLFCALIVTFSFFILF